MSGIQQIFRRAVVATALFALVSVPQVASAQTVNFSSLGYAASPCLWGGQNTEIGAHEGMEFYGVFALDVASYQACWSQPTPLNGYVTALGAPIAPVLALIRWPAFIQMQGGGAFNLQQLSVGAGWTNATLTFSGFQGPASPANVAAFTTVQTIQPFGLTDIFFSGWGEITHLTVSVAYDDTDYYGIAARTGEPLYQTSFISGVTVSPALPAVVVPEPATVVLTAFGLLGVAVAARRRTRTQ